MDQQVAERIAGVRSTVRRADAETLVELMRDVTGLEPELHPGGIIGFGSYHYRYDSGREGDGPAASFAPRSTATVVYLMDGIAQHADRLARLGPYTAGVGCLYLKRLADVDLDVLADVVRESYARLTAGTYGQRAGEGADAT